MENKVLSRSEVKINREDYLRLFRLHKAYEWLANEPEAFFELWALCYTEPQKILIEKLLATFLHLSSKDLLETGKVISNHTENIWNLKSENTFFVATCDDDKPDGSQAFIQTLKNKFSITWKEKNFFNSLLDGAHNISHNSVIVLCDDFIGTGDTIKRKIAYLQNKLNERKIEQYTIKIVSIAAMEFSKETLDTLNVDYFSHYWLRKGIDESIDESEKEIYIQSMEQLEEKLLKKYRNRKLPNFGYKRSEALFALEAQNIPNNVFPIFWWPYLKNKDLRPTIFKRL